MKTKNFLHIESPKKASFELRKSGTSPTLSQHLMFATFFRHASFARRVQACELFDDSGLMGW